MDEKQRKILELRDKHRENFRTLSHKEKGQSRDYIKMVAVEEVLAKVFGMDKIALVESRE